MNAFARDAATAARATTAVFLREAIRSSRRWQTHALRAGFSFVLLAVVLGVWATQVDALDVSALSEVGRGLFFTYVYVQLLLASFLAPLLVGTGILEEREDRTLELLAITRLGPRQIVWGKIVSRLLVLLTVIVGSTPVLGLSLTFGGVSGWELVNAVANTVVVVVVLGCVGGFVSLFAKGSLAPVVAALLYAFLAFLCVPLLFILLANLSANELAMFSPVFAAMEDSWRGLLPVVAFAPVFWLLLRWSGPVFAMVTADDDDPLHDLGHLSVEFWRFETYKRRAGLVGLAVVALAPFAWTVGLTSRGSLRVPWGIDVSRAVVYGWTVLLLLASTALLLLWWIVVARRVQGLLALGGVRALVLPRAARTRRAPRLPVWPNPVAWREIATGALGTAGPVAWAATALWVVALGLVFLAGGLVDVGSVLLAIPAIAFGLFVAVAMSTQSMVDDRRSGNLELLAASTLSPAAIVRGKLAAVLGASGPIYLGGWGLVGVWSLSRSIDSLSYSLSDAVAYECTPDVWFPSLPPLKLLLMLGWVVGTWVLFALLSMITALWMRASRLAWAVNVTGGVSFFALPLTFEALEGGRWGARAAELWLPILHPSWYQSFCGTPATMFGAALGVWVAVTVAWVVLVTGLRRWSDHAAG